MDFRGFKLKQDLKSGLWAGKKISSMWHLNDWKILKQQSNIFSIQCFAQHKKSILRVMNKFIFTGQFPGVSTDATIPPATTLHSHMELRLQFFKEEILILILTKTIMKPKAYM